MPPRFDMPRFWGNRGIIAEVKYHKCTSALKTGTDEACE